ncbi:MAG TPA: nitronate monooxygenase [Xanthobacteraceae bacterium]|nr:nitronate monooxygenase [Xanthobacteraceae bacterium]
MLQLLKIEHPIIQAPMGMHTSPEMPVAVCKAGGLGSFPCARLTAAQLRDVVAKIRAHTNKPLNLNFFDPITERNAAVEAAWLKRLATYYTELGVNPPAFPTGMPPPFNSEICDVVVELKPEVVSFHARLPDKPLIDRLKAAGCLIFSSATTVAEARWLEGHGVDAIVAQGLEAGGHRGMFLTTELASQMGTLALVPQVVDAVKVPVIAAGGIADGRGIAAALALGASAVQMGTAYLHCPEAPISAQLRAALRSANERITVISNVVTGRPARVFMTRIVREVGPIAADVPSFPLGIVALGPLRAKAELQGSDDFSGLNAGQSAALGRALPAGELTSRLATEALERLAALTRT